MSGELLKAKGRLADLEKQYETINMKAEAYLIQIRELLDPFSEFLDLELEKTFVMVKDFRDLQIQARDITAKIAKIKDDWGL
jgi:hypothetical protein